MFIEAAMFGVLLCDGSPMWWDVRPVGHASPLLRLFTVCIAGPNIPLRAGGLLARYFPGVSITVPYAVPYAIDWFIDMYTVCSDLFFNIFQQGPGLNIREYRPGN